MERFTNLANFIRFHLKHKFRKKRDISQERASQVHGAGAGAGADGWLCPRCGESGLEAFLTSDASRSEPPTVKLNPTYRFRFHELEPDCELCSFLTQLIRYSPEHTGDFYLVTAPAIHRIEPDFDLKRYGNGCNYATYIFVAQMIDYHGQRRLQLIHEAPNAFGFMEKMPEPKGMEPRILDAHINYKLISRWLETCERNHGNFCQVAQSHELSIIRLIDINRLKLVRYQDVGPCDYLCLSYVWGKSRSPRLAFNDRKVKGLPRTIQDALEVVRGLGKRYIWIDMLCIDQEDEANKLKHIEIMSKIYRGAWATIVALEGDSVDSGIFSPVINTTDERYSYPATGRLAKYRGKRSQLSCNFKGQRLLTVQRTLAQQVAGSVWHSRAWTYQEAILSPRCLYFTSEQVYFECNTIQCCESIDEKGSAYHDFQVAKFCNQMVNSCNCQGWTQNAMGSGVLRDPLAAAQNERECHREKQRISRYKSLVEPYSTKKMTFDSDAINAFQAIISQLQTGGFEQGFIWGLPIDILPDALLWQHRGHPNRRKGFPSWSWAGWDGELFDACNTEYARCDDDWYNYYRPPFSVFRATTNEDAGVQLSPLFELPRKRWSGWRAGYDPILDLADVSMDRSFPFKMLDSAELGQTLFVEGVMFRPGILQALPEYTGERIQLGMNAFAAAINGQICVFTSPCPDARYQLTNRKPVSLLLIGRDNNPYVSWRYDFLILSGRSSSSNTAPTTNLFQRLGMVWMFFDERRESHNDICQRVFTPENTEKAFIGLL